MAGKDTFILTTDSIKALNEWGAYSGDPKSKKARRDVQQVFNDWSSESGLCLSEMSRILALSVD